jgi:glutaredoxin-like protein NrdH
MSEPAAVTVVVYSAGHSCKPCQATKRLLTKLSIPFTELPIDGDMAKWAELQWPDEKPSAPIVQVGGGDQWFGHRPERISGLLA